MPTREESLEGPSHPFRRIGELRQVLDRHPFRFVMLRRENYGATACPAMEGNRDGLRTRRPPIEVEGIERPEDLDIEAGFFPSFAQDRLDSRLPLFHPATPCFPLAWGFLFGHVSLEEQDVVISLDKETHDDLKASAHVWPRVASPCPAWASVMVRAAPLPLGWLAASLPASAGPEDALTSPL